MKIGTGDDDDGIDTSQMPKFEPPKQALAEIVAPIIPDIGILGAGILLAFIGAFVGFLRYDVR